MSNCAFVWQQRGGMVGLDAVSNPDQHHFTNTSPPEWSEKIPAGKRDQMLLVN